MSEKKTTFKIGLGLKYPQMKTCWGVWKENIIDSQRNVEWSNVRYEHFFPAVPEEKVRKVHKKVLNQEPFKSSPIKQGLRLFAEEYKKQLLESEK